MKISYSHITTMKDYNPNKGIHRINTRRLHLHKFGLSQQTKVTRHRAETHFGVFSINIILSIYHNYCDTFYIPGVVGEPFHFHNLRFFFEIVLYLLKVQDYWGCVEFWGNGPLGPIYYGLYTLLSITGIVITVSL